MQVPRTASRERAPPSEATQPGRPFTASLRFTSLHDVVYILVWSFIALFVAWLTAKHREVVASLRNNEAKLEEAQRVAHVGYWENDLDTDRITWSDEIYHILGLRPNEDSPTAAEFQERIHPEDRQLQAEAIARAYRGESRYDIEYRVVRPDGEVRTVRSVGDVVWDASGRPCRAFGVVQDITERKRAQEALWASERKYRILMNSLMRGMPCRRGQLRSKRTRMAGRGIREALSVHEGGRCRFSGAIRESGWTRPERVFEPSSHEGTDKERPGLASFTGS